MALLEEYDVPLEGANAVVVGRSNIVGKPVALLLLHANATVTVCHSRTTDLAAHTREADVLVVGGGPGRRDRPRATCKRGRDGDRRGHEPRRRAGSSATSTRPWRSARG